MIVIEYRIPLPMTVEEFQVAQLHMVMKASQDNTGDGEGVEVLKNEPFDNIDGHMKAAEISKVDVPKVKGQYTLKKYHLQSRIPAWIRAMVPTDAMFLYEEAWNAYPVCKTVLTNGYLAIEKFSIVIETWHTNENGQEENVGKLDGKKLKQRKVVNIDIAEPVPTDEYVEEQDPQKFTSKKTGRGPIQPGWSKEKKEGLPVMCCYKIVTAQFKYWGFQTKCEGMIEGFEGKLFKQTNRQAFCLTDEWHGMTMEEIREEEKKVAAALADKRKNGKITSKLAAD
eukprot:TRINITY_DN15448_c0_g1_i1.p1 TRINITY_DN15448_c0_g1~~TRINITY_DN15448_c0_g1_i1.p1  ORF type:complete len:301 (+),score=92.22 TRINITY_DN15448_c0_g1_i1:60-905(+)